MDRNSILLVCRNVQGGMKAHLRILIQGLVRENFRVSVASPLDDLPVPQQVKIHPIAIPDLPSSTSALTAINHLSCLIRNEQYDLVHTHGYAAGITGRLAALWAGKKTLVHTVHNFFPTSSPVCVYAGKVVEIWLSRYTHKIITVSEQLRNDLIKMGIAPGKLVTIYNGIEAARFREKDRIKARTLLGLSEREKVIGTVARLIPAKGIDIFLQALALLNKTTPVTGIIIGDGPQREKLYHMAQALGLSGNVHFLGQREDVPDILPAFDIFILPSRQEGFGLSLLESQWLGLPVIASDTGGIREIIEHGINGLLFSPGQFRELTRQVSTLMSNDEFRNKLAEKGMEKVRNKFSTDKMIESTILLYRKLLADKKD